MTQSVLSREVFKAMREVVDSPKKFGVLDLIGAASAAGHPRERVEALVDHYVEPAGR